MREDTRARGILTDAERSMTKQTSGRVVTPCPVGLCIDLEEHVGGAWVPATSREQYVNLDDRVERSTGPHPQHGRVVRLRGRVTEGGRAVPGRALRWTLGRDAHNGAPASESGLGARGSGARADSVDARTDAQGLTQPVDVTLSEYGGDHFTVQLRAAPSPRAPVVHHAGSARFTVWRKLFYQHTHMLDAAGGDTLALPDAALDGLARDLADPSTGIWLRLVRRTPARPPRIRYRRHLQPAPAGLGPLLDPSFVATRALEPFVLRFIGLHALDDPSTTPDPSYFVDSLTPSGTESLTPPFLPAGPAPAAGDRVLFTSADGSLVDVPARLANTPLPTSSFYERVPEPGIPQVPGFPPVVRLRIHVDPPPEAVGWRVQNHGAAGFTAGASYPNEQAPPRHAAILVPMARLLAQFGPTADLAATLQRLLVHEVGHALGLAGRNAPFLPSSWRTAEYHCPDTACVMFHAVHPSSGLHYRDAYPSSSPVPPPPGPTPYCRHNLRRQPLGRAVLQVVWRHP